MSVRKTIKAQISNKFTENTLKNDVLKVYTNTRNMHEIGQEQVNTYMYVLIINRENNQKKPNKVHVCIQTHNLLWQKREDPLSF